MERLHSDRGTWILKRSDDLWETAASVGPWRGLTESANGGVTVPLPASTTTLVMPPSKPPAKKKPGPDFQAAKAHAQRIEKSRSNESFSFERQLEGTSNDYGIPLVGWPKRYGGPHAVLQEG